VWSAYPSGCVFRRGLTISLLALLVSVPSALASDPGRWRETGRDELPITYYQGVTHDPAGSWYFDGIYAGLWRTDTAFTQTGGNPNAFPADVSASEQYNHIGDLTFDPSNGGRLILPVECYYPPQGNTCNNGAFGVGDPATLTWQHYVKLDPAEIPKAMWAEVSPDDQLIWTSAGDDLLAYRVADVSPANAAPAAPIKAVTRLKGAVPPSGITGATFIGSRLFVAGTEGDTKFEVWSIDLSDGSRRLELERDVVGESEGLDNFHAAGGELHWLIQPFNTIGPPTYGADHATLLHFVPGAVPAAPPPPGSVPKDPAHTLRLRVKPRHVKIGKKVRFVLRVHTGDGKPVRRARVTLAGSAARTTRKGVAVMRMRLRSPGKYRAVATRPGKRPAHRTVVATGRVEQSSKRAAATPPPAR
jgi:hypothetical protein